MLRKILAVVLGVLAAVVVILVVESLGHYLFPPPPDIDMTDREAVRAMAASMPAGAFLTVLAAWTLGALAGGVAAILVSPGRPWPAWVVAGVVLLFAILNMAMIPHPLWMMIAAPLLLAGAGWLAGRLLAGPVAARAEAQA